ncbi:Na(+)-translocating NADH-quinone reductase subunit A [Perlabentimonas gracilis]|uniref:Na(+)-translocating NADH-quinone reductase subunit A n=1 Tax=Perlabentimonas gracilis TaxID=2715279 RepID=UPI001407DFA8|nr:Na(+)-translocating NADH-quinone reductase subunit A [Perlabentimonas gracilis]NHB67244.1 Na(+)-translocating NADH-quinone reductase subunit A [Perlabentimonas gracilis]
MPKVFKIRKGLNIPLKGEAEKVFTRAELAEFYAVKPTDFPGLTPKLSVAEGDKVKVGTPLFYDKYRTSIYFTSPVSGVVHLIRRGERRKILEVVVKTDNSQDFEEFGRSNPKELSREQVVERMLKAGLWPTLRQRPYSIIANPEDKPKAIHISGFDTSPLSPDLDFAVKDEGEAFQAGIDALNQLAEGNVNLNLNADYPPSSVYTKVKGVKFNYFSGPHPAGNVGVQIHHVAPINKGDLIWVVNPLDVIIIGRLFLRGIYDATKVIALAGSEVQKPRYFIVKTGASIANIIADNVTKNPEELRFISGNVLTGAKIEPDGFLGFYDNMVTVIPEGNYYEFLGWAQPGFKKYSFTSAFLSSLLPGRKYTLDTNLHGGERAYVVTGQYEKVLPMDIYPVHLIKAILAKDIDKMENLGIYEVAEEDFALCEYVCTSKTNVQEIIREGLDLMIKELG